jgi:tetratricopeptide (TPR) repeat protein
MAATFLLLLLALTVKNAGTPLRSGCSSDASLVATLPAGAILKIRFAMSGEATPCYKVAAEFDGKTADGYLPASAMDGLEVFDKSRKGAAWVDASASPSTAPAAQTNMVPADAGIHMQGSGILYDAQRLVEQGRPEDALRMLEFELRAHPNDAGLLALAGLAAWKNQDNRQALEYWRKSLDLAPNAVLEKLYASVDREVKNDVSKETLYGMRVVLRYDDVTVPVETARQMVQLVDQTYARVSSELGCTTKERIPTIVQSREAYFKMTGAAEWSGGLFDGRIHMPAAAGQQFDANMQKALTHETVHACLAMIGPWPSWLHEGMAQKLSGDVLSPQVRAQLQQLEKDGKLPKLGSLSQGWMGLDSHNAAIAYAMALQAVELLYDNYHSDGVRNLMRNPERLPAITTDLEKRMAE